ncbi:hypothetical protein F5Y12DRAFT_799397 [Xylaria sp. FL1777]|nr:hypothetical protein F5Y12DRAFT_799397 [Xylaria sp. FL1777]
MAPRDALHVGPCHYVTGRQRYHTKPSIPIPWESPLNTPIHLNPESDSDSDLDMTDDQVSHHVQEDQDNESSQVTSQDTSQDDQDDQDDHDDQEIAAQGNPFPETLIDDQMILLVQNNNLANPHLTQIGFNSQDINVPINAHQTLAELGLNTPNDDLSDMILGMESGELDDEDEEDDHDHDNDNDNDDDDDDDDEDDNESDESSEDKVPPVAPYRLNLTALSQRYNMYAVAYRSAIHISRIRSCVDNTLPARPDLILKPPTTPEALRVGGYLDNNMPHQMNHLIMGDLGDEEILLLACDDGDVLAYYNAHIEKALLRLESSNALQDATIVRPFFHQNVGISAWGLAVHKQSRLIAVGNNNYQVHVFALALTEHTSSEGDAEPPYGRDLFMRLTRRLDGDIVEIPEVLDSEIKPEIPFSDQRNYGYRIILETGERGSNMPNVAFSDNADGDAIKVLAVDISGKLWVLDIWSFYQVPHESVESLYRAHQKSQLFHNLRRRVPISLPRGWGILVLPPSSFLPTSTFEDSLGLGPEEAVYVQNDEYGYYIGTENAVKHIKNNSGRHPWVRDNRASLFQVAPPHWHGFDSPGEWYDFKLDCKKDWNAARDKAIDNMSEHVPPSLQSNAGNGRLILPDGSSVMRTYEMDIELVADNQNVGIMFKNAIYQKKPQQALLPHIPFPPERLANLLHVPELSLVVAGSMCGRVALITLTRPVNPNYSFKRGFKVEAILPKTIDEDRRVRPICLLLGVAIGPIMLTGRADDRPLGERRYRIMLHYYDHRILSYELYRNVLTNELSVI